MYHEELSKNNGEEIKHVLDLLFRLGVLSSAFIFARCRKIMQELSVFGVKGFLSPHSLGRNFFSCNR